MAYTLIGKIRPTHRGTWSAAAAYTTLDIVRSADGYSAYIALRDVPAGTALTNTVYWELLVKGGDGGGSESGAPAFDPTKSNMPVLHLTGDTSAMNKDTKVTLNYVYGGRSGTLTCKWQGSSSIAYPKKNYTVEFDTSFEAKEGWGSQKKYCLKANWVDPSNVRNLLGAKIWGKLVKIRSGVSTRLSDLPNGGAIDGFQIWVVINGQPQGIYTMTIPKDAWLFGMTGAAGEGFVCAEICTLNGSVVGDGTDVKVEYAADSSALIASLNRMIAQVNAVQSADDLTALEAVVDINSVIDYYVLMATLCHIDGISRNYILGTYDGVKWFMSAYDMDATFGNNPEGTKLGWPNDWPMFTGVTGTNNLLDVVKTYYMPQIRERYQTLRYWQIGEVDLQHDIYGIQLEIPAIAQIEEARLWPTRPGAGASSIDQIQNWLRVRFASLDYNVTTE